MVTRRWDYGKIKQDFFNSDYRDVTSFIKDKFWIKTLSGQRLRNTKGWAKEKNEFLQKISDEAIEKSIEVQAEKLCKEIDMTKLFKNKQLIYDNIEKDLNDMYNNKKVIKPADLEKYLKMLQDEMHDQETAKHNREFAEQRKNWTFDFSF